MNVGQDCLSLSQYEVDRHKSKILSDGDESERHDTEVPNGNYFMNRYSVNSVNGSSQILQKEQITSEKANSHVFNSQQESIQHEQRLFLKLKREKKALLIRTNQKGKEKLEFIKVSHFKLTELEEGKVQLEHRKAQKTYLVKIELWKQGPSQNLITLRELKYVYKQDSRYQPPQISKFTGREERKGRFRTMKEEDVDGSTILEQKQGDMQPNWTQHSQKGKVSNSSQEIYCNSSPSSQPTHSSRHSSILVEAHEIQSKNHPKNHRQERPAFKKPPIVSSSQKVQRQHLKYDQITTNPKYRKQNTSLTPKAETQVCSNCHLGYDINKQQPAAMVPPYAHYPFPSTQQQYPTYLYHHPPYPYTSPAAFHPLPLTQVQTFPQSQPILPHPQGDPYYGGFAPNYSFQSHTNPNIEVNQQLQSVVGHLSSEMRRLHLQIHNDNKRLIRQQELILQNLVKTKKKYTGDDSKSSCKADEDNDKVYRNFETNSHDQNNEAIDFQYSSSLQRSESEHESSMAYPNARNRQQNSKTQRRKMQDQSNQQLQSQVKKQKRY